MEFVVCCLLFAVCRLLSVVNLIVDCWSLCVGVRCALPFVDHVPIAVRCLLFVARCVLVVVRCVVFVGCCLLFVV